MAQALFQLWQGITDRLPSATSIGISLKLEKRGDTPPYATHKRPQPPTKVCPFFWGTTKRAPVSPAHFIVQCPARCFPLLLLLPPSPLHLGERGTFGNGYNGAKNG